jgi:hypothetical protein
MRPPAQVQELKPSNFRLQANYGAVITCGRIVVAGGVDAMTAGGSGVKPPK